MSKINIEGALLRKSCNIALMNILIFSHSSWIYLIYFISSPDSMQNMGWVRIICTKTPWLMVLLVNMAALCNQKSLQSKIWSYWPKESRRPHHFGVEQSLNSFILDFTTGKGRRKNVPAQNQIWGLLDQRLNHWATGAQQTDSHQIR